MKQFWIVTAFSSILSAVITAVILRPETIPLLESTVLALRPLLGNFLSDNAILLIVTFVGVTTTSISLICSGFLLSMPILRRLFIGHYWIEGYWILKSEDRSGNIDTILWQLYYQNSELNLVSIAHRKSKSSNSLTTRSSQSIFCVVDFGSGKYINVMDSYVTRGQAIAYGQFMRQGFRSTPNYYSGYLVLLEGEIFNQRARRISGWKITLFRLKYKSAWMSEIISRQGHLNLSEAFLPKVN